MISKMPDDRFKMPDNASGAYGILLLQAISCEIHSVPFPILAGRTRRAEFHPLHGATRHN